MSHDIGPNGFHDGEFPDYDNYDEDADQDALGELCDNPAYLVVGADDDLVDNLPGWVEDLITDHEFLAGQAEKIGLEPSFYVTVPDRGSNSELRDFLGELGFTVDSSYIERGPGSSVDGVVFVRKSKIPSLERKAARSLDRARKAIVTAARKHLKPGKIKPAEVHEELARLVSVAQLGDKEFRDKLDNLHEKDEEIAHLRELLSDSNAGRARAEGEAKDAKSKLVGENGRIRDWVKSAQTLSDRYAAWTLAVAAEFGITIQGPLLKLPDGQAFVVGHIFGQDLEKALPSAGAALKSSEPAAAWLRIENRVRRGMSSIGALTWSEATEHFAHRLTWGQVWWIILGREHARFPVRLFRYEQRKNPDGSFGGFLEKSIFEDENLGLNAEQVVRWKQLLKEHWGAGLDLRERPPGL
ncbi:MAG: hypothetical protein FJ384_05340 [Verrucomicrobia bacterium]|nr:hypothetical protein [Verrucomicrobiota bacterium]